jgi:hypothetical protein
MERTIFRIVSSLSDAVHVIVLAGELEQHGGAQLGYLAVIVPCAAIAAALIAGSRPWNVAARMTAPYSSS